MPDPESIADDNERSAAERALDYMGLTPARRCAQIHVDTVFLGSCTNGRIEDLRAAADILRGRHIDPTLRMLVVPGSMRVKAQAEAEGLDAVFTARRRRVAQRGLLDVPGNEPGPAGSRRAQRVHLQPEFRGPAGQGWSHAPGFAAGGRGDRGARHPVLPGRSRAGAGRWSDDRDRPLDRPTATTLADPYPARHRSDQETTMDAFTTHTGVGIPLRRSNVDTDQIIPAVYLKRITRTGFEDGLFAAWRADPDLRAEPAGLRRPARCWSPVPTSAPDRHGSTRSGR